MINFSDIGSNHFVTELDIIRIAVASGTTSLEVTIKHSESGVDVIDLHETYIPVDGVVTLYYIARLLRPLIDGVRKSFVFIAGSASKSPNVYQSRVMLSKSAQDWLPARFLTTAQTERDTTVGLKESLTFVAAVATVVNATCMWRDDDDIVTDTIQVATFNSAGVYTVNVSPELFVDNTKGELIGYTITASGTGESRGMKYRVVPSMRVRESLLFLNNFGAWETMHFLGMHEFAPKITRNATLVNSAWMNYEIDEVAEIKGFTGPIRPAGILVANDIARSPSVWGMDNDGDPTDELAILNSETKYTDADADIPEFTLTWRRSANNPNYVVTKEPPHIFDDTFDGTYE